MSVARNDKPDAWEGLRAAQQRGALPQSLLLSGPVGSGRLELARRLAARGLCERPAEDACGTCGACRQLAAGAHPDYIEYGLLEDKREVLIDQIREFCQRLQLTASQSRGRYAVLQDADCLNRHAANALLKTLEEPPRQTTIMLIASRLSRLPATIRSRCLRVSLPAVAQPPEEQRAWDGVLGDVQRGGDPLAAAASVDSEQLDAFLAWWQSWLLQRMRHGDIGMECRRLWDALVRARAQGQGSANPLLTLEGLFILFARFTANRGPGQS